MIDQRPESKSEPTARLGNATPPEPPIETTRAIAKVLPRLLVAVTLFLEELLVAAAHIENRRRQPGRRRRR